jgi:hypothetical protein
MMKVIVTFHDTAQKVMKETMQAENKVNWSMISTTMRETLTKVTDMKFELPRQPDAHFKTTYGKLCEEIAAGFRNLGEVA